MKKKQYYSVEVTHYFQGGEREPDNWSVSVEAKNKRDALKKAKALVQRQTKYAKVELI